MTMSTTFLDISDTRIPGFPNATLQIDNSPLRIISTADFSSQTDTSNLTTATGIATILYNWCPSALHAFLDLDAWFSFTWTCSTATSKIEIGRVQDLITIGTLDANGQNWFVMLSYNISTSSKWIPNTSESMLGDHHLTNAAQIDRLGGKFVRQMLLDKRWETAKNVKHELCVEYAPMDIWGDGILISPHWLYSPLNLACCTVCTASKSLNRCARCGTASYCSTPCQKRDWAVHKTICNLGLEDRGRMIHLSQKGGLVAWDVNKTTGDYEGHVSKNPNFVVEQPKRKIVLSEEKENS
jgi:hypothetical protein